MKIRKKNRAKRGETLVEILVAILIIALSAALFSCLYTASMNINLKAREEDEQFYKALDELESIIGSDETTETPGKLKYEPRGDDATGEENGYIDVYVFTQDGMTAYKGKD